MSFSRFVGLSINMEAEFGAITHNMRILVCNFGFLRVVFKMVVLKTISLIYYADVNTYVFEAISTTLEMCLELLLATYGAFE